MFGDKIGRIDILKLFKDLEIRIRQLETDSDSNRPDKKPGNIQLLSSFRVHAPKLIGLAQMQRWIELDAHSS